jgi:hypothetical protein
MDKAFSFIQMEQEITKSIYEILLNKIPPPTSSTIVWSETPKKLGVCLIELRSHEYMKQVLYNMCNIYGGTDVVLYIIHGLENEQYIKNITCDWKNVNYVKLHYKNISINEYNEMLVSPTFYDYFKTEYVLFFQTDTIIRKQIPDEFFNYAYVGAPWTGYPNDYPDNPHIKVGNKLVGNGGFSLRLIKRMKEICINHKRPNSKLHEDVFISNHLLESEIPSVKEAKKFSVEMIYHEDPVGLHQVWLFHPPDRVRHWFSNII